MKKLTVAFMPHPPIIIPQIGGGEGVLAQKTIDGMKTVSNLIKSIKPDTIIFITPHGNSFNNGVCVLYGNELQGDFSSFGNGDISFEKEINKELTERINFILEEKDILSVLMDNDLAKYYNVDVSLDSGVMVPMHFIDQYYNNYNIVHITPGFISYEDSYKMGSLIGDILTNIGYNSLVVCSGDLSHTLKEVGPYKYNSSGAILDEMICTAIKEGDPLPLIMSKNKLIKDAGECGLRSFLVGFGVVDGLGYESKLISYEGPFGVGYATGYLSTNGTKKESLFKPLEENKEKIYLQRIIKEDDYIKLARMSIEYYVTNNRKINIGNIKNEISDSFIKEAINNSGGVFVSIYSQGQLRGCIGTIMGAKDCLLEEIVYNSISACSNDTRFDPIEVKELKNLDIRVDILMKPELVLSKEELDVFTYGIIVQQGDKRGVLLPNIDGVKTVDEQIEIAMDKAGVLRGTDFEMYRFKVIRHCID